MVTARETPLTVTQFTDPICAWCWGFEPVVRHLQISYGTQIRIDTRIFDTDPAQSTYSASVAFVAARLQDETVTRQYLRSLREAAKQWLEAFADGGVVEREPRGTGLFWQPGGED